LEARALLARKHLSGADADWADLAGRYGSNGLALKIAGESIRQVFAGGIAAFLDGIGSGTAFGGIRRLLAERGPEDDTNLVVCQAEEYAVAGVAGAATFSPRRVGDVGDVVRYRLGGLRTVAARPGPFLACVLAVVSGEPERLINVYVSPTRDAVAACTFFERAIESTGTTPRRVITDKAATYTPALATVVPGVLQRTGRNGTNGIERDHGFPRERLRPMRGVKSVVSAAIFSSGHALVRNIRGGFYSIVESVPQRLRLAWAWIDWLKQFDLAPTSLLSRHHRADVNFGSAPHTDAREPLNVLQSIIERTEAGFFTPLVPERLLVFRGAPSSAKGPWRAPTALPSASGFLSLATAWSCGSVRRG
jgi:hypothetical protein